MTWTVDHIIFFSFLTLNVVLGLTSSRGITTLKQYALGDRNFSTGAIVSTLVATWICGEFFYTILTETYKTGLYFIIATSGNVVCFLIVSYFFIPRMAEFLGKLSIAEVMGELYGQKTRLITATAGFICVSGVIAVQLRIAGSTFEYILNIPSMYGIIFAGIVITLYSTLGGIKSVTFTDMIQFFTFGTIIPLVTYYIFFYVAKDTHLIVSNIAKDPNFNLKIIFDTSNNKFWTYLFLTFYMIIPAFNPAIFQRISMSKNVYQAQRSFYIFAFFVLLLTLLVAWLAITLNFYNSNIMENDLFKSIFDITPTPYKGLLLIGIVAMVMSTVDSYINSSSILITYDFIGLFKKLKNELLTARIVSFLLGLSGIFFAFKQIGLLQLIILSSSFYMTTVTVPFIMAVLGYRTPYEKAVLWGMGAGLSVVLLWNYYNITIIDSVVPAMLANLVVLVFMHYYYHNQFLKSQNN